MKKQKSKPDFTVTLTLSTGYQIKLDPQEAREGLEHMVRALMGEIMFPKLRKSPNEKGWTPGIEAARQEVIKVICKMNKGELRCLAYGAIWSHLVGEFGKLEAEGFAEN